jgi:hypothetical protein
MIGRSQLSTETFAGFVRRINGPDIQHVAKRIGTVIELLHDSALSSRRYIFNCLQVSARNDAQF